MELFDKLIVKFDALTTRLNKTIINHGKCAKIKRTATYITTRIELLNSLYTEILQLNNSIVSLDSDESIEFIDSEKFMVVEDEYIAFKARLLDELQVLQPTAAPLPSLPTPPPVQNVNLDARNNEFRLPTISIPTFNGDYSSWPSFKNSFEHLVANNQNLTGLQRLHYLKNSLTGEARKLIQHYDITDANYTAAWDKLKLRFDNKKLLINNHLKAIIHAPTQSKETAVHIRSLIDVFTDSLNGLRTLGVQTNEWDPIIIHLLIEKVSSETHSLWETSQMANNDLPTLSNFLIFLENRFRTLEAIAEKPARSHANPFDSTNKPNIRVSKKAHSYTATIRNECILCKSTHYLRSCPSFLRLSEKERLTTAQQLKVCINCLVPGHSTNQCRNKMNCTICDKRHHTLLHFPPNLANATAATNSPQSSQPSITLASFSQSRSSSPTSTKMTFMSTPNANQVVLATACVNVVNRLGNLLPLRALIDPGSQVSFITTKALQRLQLKPSSTNAKIFGIGQTYSGTSTKSVCVTFQSVIDPDVQIMSEFLTIPQITGSLPQSSSDVPVWPHLKNLRLADPFYNRSGPIDLLLSAEIYGKIILPGIQRGDGNQPVAQNTSIGWILLGGNSPATTNNILSMHTCIDIDSRLRAFWESEELSSAVRCVSSDDVESENHFCSTYERDLNGRFVVRLPFKTFIQPSLGFSRDNAISRLLQIERKFVKDPQLAADYRAFMSEYEKLGHMKQAPTKVDAYYIPHHPVIKQSSTTTKLRVVFDASRKTNLGTSLNDHLRIGPTIQSDLVSLLTRWRKYPIAFMADLEKMYRQIKVNEKDQDFQRIVWRNSPDDQIQDYKLLTVTYGTACAQYLAVRSLHQLAYDGALSYPLASKRILEDFYVDDLLSGSYDVSEALNVQQQLRTLSSSAGLNLRKWASNNETLLTSIPREDREIKTSRLIEFDDTIKSLGIRWNPCTDEFTYTPSLDPAVVATTKRAILSEVSKLFDPLGWLSPIIIQAKLLMQQMWILNAGWDDMLPESVLIKWKQIRKDLQHLHIISIPRSKCHSNAQSIELHGFSDASIQAFAAVVYSRILQPDGTYIITLLAAKSRVAPIKQITLPRLELCGAHLLSKLINKVRHDLQIEKTTTYAWCDSTIVLQWLQGHPNRLKTFVANRVSDILDRGNIHCWRHIPGKDNPADCATRGLEVEALKTHAIWWGGPSFLRQKECDWPLSVSLPPEPLPDVKAVSLTVSPEVDCLGKWIESYSSMTKLVRVIALLQRFIHNIRSPNHRVTGPTNLTELTNSHNLIICIIQTSSFPSEYKNLQSNRPIHRRSSILSLNPFIDQNKLLRVGGRLHNSNMSYEAKHPIILPKTHHVTSLIIQQMHKTTLHGGAELVVTMLRRKYWIISMRSAVRYQIHRCIRCFRFNARKCEQLMGSLPKPRVNIDRAFTHTGVDCAGPIDVRMSKGRGAKSYKGYIALFVCLSTKAIHIEMVSDMSSPAFLAAYRRFCARRGIPQHMYSDNGTNFVGAAKVIRTEAGIQFLNVSTDLVNELTTNGSEWHFIPPASPHFGGLWEAGIKSVKHHLKRIIGEATLTFEEISTLLSQIEACLNSRPLCPTTSDPSDYSALTPGHFLIGDALLAPPESGRRAIDTNIHNRWQLVQKMRDDFWKRWRQEYLTRLQQRPKWANKNPNININDLVIIMEDNIPPSRWALGRIISIHPGTDGLVRVVTIKCKSGTIKRPIAKVAILPTNEQ